MADVRHTVTQEDLDNNPSLVEAGTQVGDVLELSNEEHEALVGSGEVEVAEEAAPAEEEVAADAGTEEVAADAGTEVAADDSADAAGTEVAADAEVAVDAGAEATGTEEVSA